MQVAFTGPRQLTKQQEAEIYKHFCYFIAEDDATWHVGDADGLDNFVRRAAGYYQKQLTVYKVEGSESWQFAKRSKQMVDAIATLPNSWLYAFPNKLCPEGCKPSSNPSGQGSGTWLTIAYAKYRGLQIYLFPLFKTQYKNYSWMPDWLQEKPAEQLSLF